MAVNLPISVDPSQAEEGLDRLDKKLQGTADVAENSAGRSDAAYKQAGQTIEGMTEQVERSGAASSQAANQAEAAIRKEADALSDAERAAAGIADNLDDAADLAVDAANAAGDTADQMERTGRAADDATAKVDKTGGSFLELNNLLELGAKAVEGIAAGIDALAEGGNASAIELQGSFSKFRDELFSIADDPRFQSMLLDVSNVIVQDVIPALRAMADVTMEVMTESQNSVADWIVSAGEYIGVLEAGTYDVLQADQERKAASVEAGRASSAAARAEKAAKEEVLDVTKELAKIDADRAAANQSESLQEVGSLQEIQDIIDETRENLQEENLTNEEKLALLNRVRQAEQRKLDIAREAKAEDQERQREARRSEDAKKRADEAEAKRAEDKAKSDAEAAQKRAQANQRERDDVEETARVAVRTRSAVVRQASDEAASASEQVKKALTDPGEIDAWLRQWASATGRGVNTAKQMFARGDITPGVTPMWASEPGGAPPKGNGQCNQGAAPETAGLPGADAIKAAVDGMGGAQASIERLVDVSMGAWNSVGQFGAAIVSRVESLAQAVQRVQSQFDAMQKAQRSQHAQRFGNGG